MVHHFLELHPGQRVLFTDVLLRRFVGTVRCPAADHEWWVVQSNRGTHLVSRFDIVEVIG